MRNLSEKTYRCWDNISISLRNSSLFVGAVLKLLIGAFCLETSVYLRLTNLIVGYHRMNYAG